MPGPWSCRTFIGCVILLILLAGSDSCLRKAGFLLLDFPANSSSSANSDQANFEIGSEIRVNCRLLNTTYEYGLWRTEVDHSNLRFRKRGVTLDASSELVEIVDNNTIAYVKENATVEDSGSLVCFGKGLNHKNSTISYGPCTASILVGTPPQPVSDFRCVSHSFVNLTCTWENPGNKVRTTHSIEISQGDGTDWRPCPKNQTRPNSCSWSASTNPPYDEVGEEFYFRINATNALGDKSERFRLSHASIVKLSPVRNIAVTETSPREVNVSWEAPNETVHGSWKERLTIEYKVSIDRLNSTDSRTEWTTDTVLYLDDLLPNHRYQIQVRARTEPSKQFDLYSEPVSAILSMSKARPDGPPSLPPSAFRYKLFKNVRTVTLLFSEVPQLNWNDDHFEYVVQVCSDPDRQCYNKTFEHTNAELKDLSISTLYIIRVWSRNSLGPSDTSSRLVIRPHSQLLPHPTNVQVELGNNKATLMWETPPTLARWESLRADVFWCRRSDEQRCRGEVFTRQAESRDSFSLKLNDASKYMYGVALFSSNGRTSGSVWSVCGINAGAYVGQVEELEVLPDTGTSLKLKWKKGCRTQREYVAGYQVEYCRMEHQEEDIRSYADKCHHEWSGIASVDCHLQNFTVPTKEDVYVLEGLQTGELYRVILRAVDSSTGKFVADSVAVCAKVGSEDRMLLIAAISAAGFVVAMLVIGAIARYMGGELHSTKLAAVRLPTKTGRIDRQNPPHNRGTEMKVIESNGRHLEVGKHITSTLNEGFRLSLDGLIPKSHLDDSLRDSEESSSLKEEPQTAVNTDVLPSATDTTAPVAVLPAVIPQAIPNGSTQCSKSPMPPYTQLGLKATYLKAAPEHPRNTGYSQLSVSPARPSAKDEDDRNEYGIDGQNFEYDNEDEDEEDRSPSVEPESPLRLGLNSGYVACVVIGSKAPKPRVSSNGCS